MVDGRHARGGAGFDCSLVQSGEAVVARLRGGLDLAAARVLDEPIQRVFEISGVGAALRFIDAADLEAERR